MWGGGGGEYKHSVVRSFSPLSCTTSAMAGAEAATAHSTNNSSKAAKRKRKNRKREDRRKWRKRAGQKCFGCLSRGCAKKSTFQGGECGKFKILFYFIFSIFGNVMHIRSIY